MGAQGQHLPGVRVRGPGLGVQVVAVVPEDHQAELTDRGEHRGPGARDHPDRTPQHGQPAAVPLGRAEIGGQADVASLAAQARGGQRRVDAGQVAGVRHDDDHAAAGRGRGGGGDGDLGGPLGAGQGRPGRPDRAALGQRGQERLSGWVPGPRAGLGPGRRRVLPDGGRAVCARVRGGRCGRSGRGGAGVRADTVTGRWCGGGGGFALRGGVPGRDGQPEHVGQRARVPVGHRAGQVEDLGREHRLRRDHPLQPGQPTLVLAGLDPVQQVAVNQLPGEPDPDPAAGHGRLVHAGRDQVVEGPVEVSERDVDRHPGDRQPLADRLILRPLRHGSVLPERSRGSDSDQRPAVRPVLRSAGSMEHRAGYNRLDGALSRLRAGWSRARVMPAAAGRVREAGTTLR